MKLMKFLKNRKNTTWDFTNDCDCNEYKKITNPIDKYFAYRSSTNKAIACFPNGADLASTNVEKYKRVEDPDLHSHLLQSIYRNLWPKLADEDYMVCNGWIQSDTMTSAQKTFSLTLETLIETEKEKDYRKSFGVRTKVSNAYCIDLYAYDPEGFKNRLLEVPGLESFLALYHTLGNYIPVPHLFNAARSGNYASHDYWDLTLQKIKDYFFSFNDEEKKALVSELLHNNGSVSNCDKWLRFFGDGQKGWQSFINENYLQDFVDENYDVVSLCEGHSWNNIKISDCIEFYLTASRLIYLRGRRMFNALQMEYSI